MKSTVPPGTSLRLMAEELADTQLQYVSNPEFLREGQALHDWSHPDRIVIGGNNEEAIALVKKMYQGIDAPLQRVTFDVGSLYNLDRVIKQALESEISKDAVVKFITAVGKASYSGNLEEPARLAESIMQKSKECSG